MWKGFWHEMVTTRPLGGDSAQAALVIYAHELTDAPLSIIIHLLKYGKLY